MAWLVKAGCSLSDKCLSRFFSQLESNLLLQGIGQFREQPFVTQQDCFDFSVLRLLGRAGLAQLPNVVQTPGEARERARQLFQPFIP